MSLYEVLAIIVGTVSIAILIVQVGVAARTLKLDHKRRKNEATINFMLQVRPLWHQGRRLIDQKWGKTELSESALTEIDENFEAHEIVRTLLGHLELLSVGVNSGVYDKNLLRRMSGAHLTRMYRRLKPYIKRMQKKQTSAYVEFERLIHEFQIMKESVRKWERYKVFKFIRRLGRDNGGE